MSIKDHSDPIALAKEILALEAQAVSGLCDHIGDSFLEATKEILSIQGSGRLVITGMGKAGFIGQKLSATFASTGVPSFFLHPAEAVHGDLGRFTESDIALILSNSGETEEIIRLLPHIKRRGCHIISMTAKPDSSLGKHSDVILQIGDWKEADPLGLAPTTSTTAMLALGDALAMAVQVQQNFTKEQFAEFHPGGSLGRALLTVEEIMRTGDNLCLVTADMHAREVLHAVSSTPGRPGAAIVVDDDKKLVGIFTDGDLRRCLAKEPNFLHQEIRKHMGQSPKSIAPHALIQSAQKIMTEHSIDQLIVVDDSNSPIGMLDIQDIASVR